MASLLPSVAIGDLDPAGVLAAAEDAVLERRTAEVRDLLLVAQWADLHAWDPKQAPGGGTRWDNGGNALVQIGGEGTPHVQDLCLVELAVARRTHHLAARAATADVLDLRHRLPRTWARVVALECEPWLARKVARMSRELSAGCVHVVDDAVADAIAGESPSRILTLAEAKVIEADRAAHWARLDEQLRRRFVSLGRTDLHGLRHVIGRVEAGAAAEIDRAVDRVADALDARRDLVPHVPDAATRDELRAEALGWLAHPDDVVALLAGVAGDGEQPSDPRARSRHGGRAVLYVHLHHAVLEGLPGVARVEDVGPMLLEQVRRLLGHSAVDLKPVVDLADETRVTAYEHPEAVKERVHLRTVGEVFPHAGATSRSVDMDHPAAYRELGPPGQTGDHNAGPLGRTNHRAKTHLGFSVEQHGLTAWDWSTPHGLRRRVDAAGTHVLPPDRVAPLVRERYRPDTVLESRFELVLSA